MLFSEFKDRYFTKNTLFTLYFIFFIILNILDFLGQLSSDLDFFKKILSWVLIWVLFYQISFTKTFIGQRLPRYDIAYIVGFSVLIIPKILTHYFKDVVTSNFVIFNPIVPYIIYVLNTFLDIIGSVFLGILVLILTNFILLNHHRVQTQSFIGSLNLHTFFGSRLTTHIALFLLVFFFAFVIAPFFLEWIALSVDALILMAGLIYYSISFIHKYRSGGKVSNFLKVVSNSGSQFFKNLISTFSNKKTFFIGVSFLLAMHLIVDLGVYMVPYLIGTSSPLYFDSLDTQTREHVPLFNMFEFSNSQSYSEISAIFNEDNSSNIILKLIQFIFLLLLYIATYFYFFILLCFPFYYIYKRIKNELVSISKTLIIFIIAMSLFYVLSQDVFMPTISMPISIGVTQSIGIDGVDIYTSSIFKEDLDITSVDFSDTISLLIFFIGIFFLFAFMKFEKYKHIFTSITYLIFLIFFVLYISLFYIDSNTGVIYGIKEGNSTSQEEMPNYVGYIGNKETKTIPVTYLVNGEMNLFGKVYSNTKGHTFFYGKYELVNIDRVRLKENKNIVFTSKDNFIIIPLEYSPVLEIEVIQQSILDSYLKNEDLKFFFLKVITQIAFFFSTIFYVFGIIIFSKHYLKTLFRGDLRIK